MAKVDLKEIKEVGLYGTRSKKQKHLIAIDLAVERGLRLAKPVARIETIALKDCHNRVLAQSIISPIAQPPFNNSAMDGYGIRLDELKGDAPWILDIKGQIFAGDKQIKSPKHGAVRIFTGGHVPSEIDAVIMQEHVELHGGRVVISKKPKQGENIRLIGEDIKAGEILVLEGELMSAAHMALAASCGLSKINVRKKIKIAYFSIGSELRQPEEKLEANQIYNSNRYLLTGLLDQAMVEAIDLGSVPDDSDQLSNVLKRAALVADIVISVGGILTAQQNQTLGEDKNFRANLHLLKLAMKPGKPMLIGKIANAIYIGLPANPMAANITFKMIAKPIIDKNAGMKEKPQSNISAISSFKRKRRPFRNEYIPVKITGNSSDGTLLIKMIGRGGSAEMLPIAQADGFAVIEPGEGFIHVDDRVKFIFN